MGKCFKCDKLCNKKTEKYQYCRYKKVISHSDEANARYEESCNMLAQSFARKHEWEFEGWTGYFNPETYSWNRYVGGHAMFGDRVVSLDDIRVDLMEDAPVDAYVQFEAETVTHLNLLSEKFPCVNYYNWLHGARNSTNECSEEWKKTKCKMIERMRNKLGITKRSLEINLENFFS